MKRAIIVDMATKPLKQSTGNSLYERALQADRRFSATITARTAGKRNRWTLTKEDKEQPEIAEAFRHKVCCDDAWFMWKRQADTAGTI